jgi:hypothetical protein
MVQTFFSFVKYSHNHKRLFSKMKQNFKFLLTINSKRQREREKEKPKGFPPLTLSLSLSVILYSFMLCLVLLSKFSVSPYENKSIFHLLFTSYKEKEKKYFLLIRMKSDSYFFTIHFHL